MNHSTPNDALNTSKGSANHDSVDHDTAKPSQRKWINLPEELPQWLSKRIEFSLPVWVFAIAALVLAFLIFD
ncbi:MAG: hypothetical protein LRY53_09665 [Burkholderiaceae bacterium]|nr:hypothetical protein [Burkholderiaceae bacterium]MCD8517547.1 hypothetical protein [Burkholderiaceae bacterium]MCD8537929.1 hypothetical protein [Burkholderiaceae bacterium]MCD8565876.1 hypothetical protein [Burkholderiaceae bacterium]